MNRLSAVSRAVLLVAMLCSTGFAVPGQAATWRPSDAKEVRGSDDISRTQMRDGLAGRVGIAGERASVPHERNTVRITSQRAGRYGEYRMSKLVRKINQARRDGQQCGTGPRQVRPALARDPRLDAVAAEVLTTAINTGTRPGDGYRNRSLRRHSYNAKRSGQSFAIGFETPRQVLQWWLSRSDDPADCQHVLGRNANLGLAIEVHPRHGTDWWVLVVATEW